MNNMNNIKVIVDYELPTTNKFDALIEQYLQAKAITETAEESIIPLIQKGGKAKYDAICEQLDVIVNQLKKILLVCNGTSASATGWYTDGHNENYRMVVTYDRSKNQVRITYRERFGYKSRNFLDWVNNQEDLLSLNGLVTRWNDFKIVEEMQKDCNQQLQHMIDTQQKKAKTIVDTLEKIRRN
jgi:hypothetical protein